LWLLLAVWQVFLLESAQFNYAEKPRILGRFLTVYLAAREHSTPVVVMVQKFATGTIWLSICSAQRAAGAPPGTSCRIAVVVLDQARARLFM
jgi:hypothetical protein